MKKPSFVLHHVGGRAGTRAFPLVRAFEHEFVSVMYEASSDGNQQILNYGKKVGTGETILVNACIGVDGLERPFNLNLDPYTSSLLRLDPQYKNFYIEGNGFDYLLGDAMSTLRTEIFCTESLDKIIKEKNLPGCDFLSIDTQGSELEILQCAEDTLRDCVGVQLEVSFVARYINQPMFGEIDKFLTSRGFNFIRFTDLKEWAPLEADVEFRGLKMHAETDALYIKSPKSLSASQYYQALFTALVLGQSEYALYLSRNAIAPKSQTDKSEWMKFCDSFLLLAKGATNSRPSFSQVFSVEQSFERFVDVDPRSADITDFKTGLRKVFWLMPASLRGLIQKFEPAIRRKLYSSKLKRQKPTEIELLFSNVGLSKVSKSLSKSRASK